MFEYEKLKINQIIMCRMCRFYHSLDQFRQQICVVSMDIVAGFTFYLKNHDNTFGLFVAIGPPYVATMYLAYLRLDSMVI